MKDKEKILNKIFFSLENIKNSSEKQIVMWCRLIENIYKDFGLVTVR